MAEGKRNGNLPQVGRHFGDQSHSSQEDLPLDSGEGNQLLVSLSQVTTESCRGGEVDRDVPEELIFARSGRVQRTPPSSDLSLLERVHQEAPVLEMSTASCVVSPASNELENKTDEDSTTDNSVDRRKQWLNLSAAERRRLTKERKMAEGTWLPRNQYSRKLSQDGKRKRRDGPSEGDFQGVSPLRRDPDKQLERTNRPKRPRRWDVPPSSTPGPSGAPGNVTFKDQLTSSKLALTPVGYPDVRFTGEDCHLLQEKLLALVFDDDSPANLQILKTSQERGALVAVCGNDDTNAWVRQVAGGIVVREGVAVVAGDYKDLLRTTKVLLRVEDLLAKVDPKKIIVQLQKQNGISTEDWRIIDVKREEGVQTLILGIDDKSAVVLRDRRWQVFVGITRVFFRVLSGGPATTKPPDDQVSASEPATQ